MGLGWSFRVAPGLRIRGSGRGLRASIGPRAARLHVGAGRPTVSTGFGPFTFWAPLGGRLARRRGRQPRPGVSRPGWAAGRSPVTAAAAQAVQRFDELTELHRIDVPPARRPVAVQLPPVDEHAVRRRHMRAARSGVGLFDRAGRAASRARAERDAAAEIRARAADHAALLAGRQAALDAWYDRLLAGDPDTVSAALTAAFAAGPGSAVCLRAEHAEATVALLAPPQSVVPGQVPATNTAGAVRMRRPTAAQHAAMYTTAVLAHVLATVKRTLAAAPGLQAVHIVVVAPTDPDAYGRTEVRCLLAGRWNRAALRGVRWQTTEAPTIAQDTATELLVNLRRGTDLVPLDLADRLDLRDLLRAIDVIER